MNSLTSKSKPISQFLFSKSPSSPQSRILFISLFNTTSSSSSSSSSSNAHQNHPPSSSSSCSPSRRQDEESKSVRVSVWWDIENCQVPNGVNVFKITQLITSAVRANGIKGPLQINAFGDVICLSRPNQEALSSTGVNLVHIPRGGKNSADRSLLVDLMYWVSQNPPPAHIFLISGDRDFAGILHKLRMNNYNILLAGDVKQTPGVLCSAASIMWHWNELTKGENLSGRHYNQPPDGPFNSWYGHYRGPLEDPYAEAQSSSVAEVLTNTEQSSEPNRHPVPLAILRQIRRVISAHPDGLNITEFRSELANNNVPLDKNFYGYKKFSSFLSSMPHIIAVDYNCPDGQFFVRPSRRGQKPVERYNASVGSMSEKKNQDIKVAKTANVQSNTITKTVDVEPQLPASSHVDHSLRIVEEKTEKTPEKKASDVSQTENQVVFTKGLPGKEASNEEVVETPVAPKEEPNSKSDGSLLKRLWTNLFGSSVDRKRVSYESPDKLDMSIGNPEITSPKEEEVKATSQYGDQHPETLSSSNAVISDDAQHPASPSSNTALDEDAKSNVSDKSEASPGFITRIISWCRSRRNSSVSTKTEQFNDEPTFIEEISSKLDDASSSRKLDDASSSRELNDASYSRKHELFSKDTFWSALQAFFKTRRGADIVINSTSREQFAEKLQKEGPLILRPLQENDLHHLVSLLVSEKKWIVEFPTKTPRFRFAQPLVESSAEVQPQNVQPHSSAGLSYIFTNSSSQGDHQSRVSSNVQKPPEKCRSDVLADCQKLLDELTLQYPEGFNMSCFKRLFLEKYGYCLDHQKLGYPKLISLLQIMPGVKVESAYVDSHKVIYSSGIEALGLAEKPSGSNGNVFDSPQKNEDGESPWEELGPVSKQERQSAIEQVNGDYEPSVSDDDEFSEMEEDDTPSSVKEDQNRQAKTNEEDSSLLQILGSWYSIKDENDPQDHGSHAEGLVDCSKKESESPQLSDTDGEGEAASASPAFSAANHAWKQRPQKSYLFVSDAVETKKDKLIDGILGSLKKSGESRMQG